MTPAMHALPVSLTPAKHRNNRISPRICEKKLKSLLGLSTGARRSCLKKKTRGKKSRGTVPLRHQLLKFYFFLRNTTDSVHAATRATKAATTSVRARRSAYSANSLVYARKVPTNLPTSLSTTRQTYKKGG